MDNYQYRETKNFKKNQSKPSIVVHNRLGNIYGATVEEVQYIKITTNINPTVKSMLKQNKSASNLRSKPVATATRTTTTTTKVPIPNPHFIFLLNIIIIYNINNFHI